MLTTFQKHIAQEFPYLEGKKLLVACSGGLDSRVLADLLNKAGYIIALAHCNFQLRNEESDGDEEFVKTLASDYDVPIYIERFNTEQYAVNEKASIQMAARELRYQWFDVLLKEKGYDYVLTAHHANDDLETFFINLSRGTGVRGLRGIPKENKRIVRPLLHFSRDAILAYAKESNLYWREDSSNSDTKYLRNKIRQSVIPAYADLGENALKGFYTSQDHLDQAGRLIEDYLQLVRKLVVAEVEEGIAIDIERIKDLPNTDALLYELLRPFGFTDHEAVRDLLNAQTGKHVVSQTHRILRNRESLLITSLSATVDEKQYEITSETESLDEPISLAFLEAERFEITNGHSVFVDVNALSFPLVLRKWEEGDSFYPFGMKGKKKLSKFFKDEKLSLVAKENCWLLCSDNEIVWVVGHRLDDRFKVTKETKNIVRIDYTPN